MFSDVEVKSIKSIDHHRNGVSGEPFSIVRFISDEKKNMVAIVFESPGQVAVFDYDKVKEDNFRFFENSWRGDVFEKDLRRCIDEHYKRTSKGVKP